MKSFYEWYRKHITGAIFGGLILGILTGLFLAGRFKVVLTATSVLGSIYMSALNMMIFPLVFCSIVMGIASIGSARTTGKITGAAMLFFLCTTALASFVGLIIPRLIRLGKGVSFKMATSDIQATKMDSILDTVKGLIPSNPVSAFAEGNMLQVLVFALIMGFTLIAIGEKGEPLLKVIDSCNEACLKIISTVMYFTPIGVFCTIVPVVEANGTKTIVSLATQLIILYVAFFGFAFVVYGGAVRNEKMTGRKLAGCILGFAGVVIINMAGGSMDMGFRLTGEGFVLIAQLSYGASTVLINIFSQKVSPVILSGCQFFMGGVLLFVVGILMGGHLDHMSVAGAVLILYLAMVSAVAYTLWSVLLAHNEVSKVAIFGFVNPLCSVVLSALVLGEVSQAFNARSLIALILVCVGIYIVNYKNKK